MTTKDATLALAAAFAKKGLKAPTFPNLNVGQTGKWRGEQIQRVSGKLYRRVGSNLRYTKVGLITMTLPGDVLVMTGWGYAPAPKEGVNLTLEDVQPSEPQPVAPGFGLPMKDTAKQAENILRNLAKDAEAEGKPERAKYLASLADRVFWECPVN